MNRRAILFFDLETTGLDPRTCSIVQAAWRRLDPTATVIQEEYVTKVLPFNDCRYEREALAVNGFNLERWVAEGAITQGDLLQRFQAASKNVVLAGHGVNFDIGFVEELYRRFDAKPEWHYQSIDTQKLAWPLFMLGRIDGVSLKNVTKYFGVGDQLAVHDALQDVQLSHEVFKKQISLFKQVFDN